MHDPAEPAVHPDGGLVGVAGPRLAHTQTPTRGHRHPDSRRFRLDLGYDGTGFSGWAVQPGLRTVAGVLAEAMSTVLREPVALTVAGRTDAGVHAAGQVCHTDLPAAIDGVWLVRRLSRLLPSDVRVRSVRAVPDAFDARFSALRRHYRYRIATAPYGPEPLRARDTLSWPHVLDLDAVDAASRPLLGEHDFAAFCRRRDGATTIRALEELRWSIDADGVVTVALAADAFCHSMVRSLVGALLDVGRGRQSPDWIASLLGRTARAGDVSVAPAHGLTLLAVDYPADADLGARAGLTRRVRTLGCRDT